MYGGLNKVMDAAAKLEMNPVSKHQIQSEYGDEQTKLYPEGNGPVPQQEESGSDQPTLTDVYRMIEKFFDRSNRKLDELT